jgi:hypothetical protein
MCLISGLMQPTPNRKHFPLDLGHVYRIDDSSTVIHSQRITKSMYILLPTQNQRSQLLHTPVLNCRTSSLQCRNVILNLVPHWVQVRIAHQFNKYPKAEVEGCQQLAVHAYQCTRADWDKAVCRVNKKVHT